jgi:hypothetical protein
MSTICLVCEKINSSKASGSGNLRARATVVNCISSLLSGESKLNNKNSTKIFTKVKLSGVGKIRPKENLSFNLISLKDAGIGSVKGSLKIQNNALARIAGVGNIVNIKADKFAGSIDRMKSIKNFQPTEKLYPISDINNDGDTYFVNKTGSSSNIFSNIDEGVFTGSLIENNNSSYIISDDQDSYIHPSSIFTNSNFRYKCEVTAPIQNAKESFLIIRASAPISNYSSDIPPQYTLHNIKLEDPSGNLIIKYKDIILRGDADYSKRKNPNYVTYISEPEVNNLLLHCWESGYPIMGEADGYTLNLNFNIECLDDPFSEGFNTGYEDTCKLDFVNTNNEDYLSLNGSPISTQSQGFSLNPTNSIRISAIEIANSGGVGVLRDNYLRFYSEVDLAGERISRNIFPSQVLTYDTDLNIYPSSQTTWISSPDSLYNTTIEGCKVLLSNLQDRSSSNYISLIYTDSPEDSGRLSLKFSHTPPKSVSSYANGAFSFGNNNDFNTAEFKKFTEADNFFTVDSIELKIVAKKAIGSNDYAIDIVGYSDDKILNISPKINAFLQNTESGTGIIPIVSGFYGIDDLGIATQSLSDKNQYYESYITTNNAGDHYKLSTTPVVNSTEFTEYSIPLTIYKNTEQLGQPTDYSMSSYFENLYLDICPLPSGASIATVYLVVNYKPSNGLMLHTLGQQSGTEIIPRDINLYPAPRLLADDTILNSDLTDGPLSLIENIPQSFTAPTTLKTNYSRRWRGVDGLVVDGPYNPNEFNFAFNNPQLNTPFLNGYFTFNYNDGNIIQSDYIGNNTAYSGIYNGIYTKIKNLGLRFNDVSLFDYPTDFTTIDWTSIAGYENNELYGKIVDAYDNAVRVSGEYGHINFGNINIDNGFAIFTRFTPDINISGVDYNLFNSGVLFAKWNNGNNLEFALGYNNGYLCGYARSDENELVTIQDYLLYSDYQYPLSVILTYTNNRLVLYANNEIDTTKLGPEAPSTIKAISNSFILDSSSNNNFVVGYCGGSGVGINAFIHEIGISSTGNILLDTEPDRLYKQTTAESFLSGHSHSFLNSINADSKFKLWDYVNTDSRLWHLGDFKICSFSADFDRFIKREGLEFITHHLKNDGYPYSDITNIGLPSNIYSSGLCYHSQIENDFLRFNLSDIPNSFDFYAIPPRISKNLPREYHFDDRALVVETIIHHETSDDIIWNDGSVGPKLIVSLYSKNQDPVDRPSKVNWGLINRSSHYLEPSGCWQKLSSTFKYDDLIDTSEPWANFDVDISTTELDHKYYSKDINDMFLQYDLVYPSGNSFDSRINIYSSHIKLEHALVKAQNTNTQFNLVASGEYKALSNINLFTTALDVSYASQNLFTIGDYVPATSSSLNIYASGANVSTGSVNLYTVNYNSENESLPIYVGGRDTRFNEENINLFTCNLLIDQSKANSLYLSTQNVAPLTQHENSFILFVRGRPPLVNYFPSQSFNLYVDGERFVTTLNDNFNLFIQSDREVLFTEDSFNLFTINYPPFNQELNQQTTITWDEIP